MTEAETALPCPFCGAPAVVTGVPGDINPRNWSAKCSDWTCGAVGPWGADRHEAVTRWNMPPRAQGAAGARPDKVQDVTLPGERARSNCRTCANSYGGMRRYECAAFHGATRERAAGLAAWRDANVIEDASLVRISATGCPEHTPRAARVLL